MGFIFFTIPMGIFSIAYYIIHKASVNIQIYGSQITFLSREVLLGLLLIGGAQILVLLKLKRTSGY